MSTNLVNSTVIRFPDGSIRYKFFPLTPLSEYHLPSADKILCKSTGKPSPGDHYSRIIETVFEYAYSNSFDWFFTMTFSPDVCDRSNYNDCCEQLKKFTKFLCKHNCRWIMIPEYHSDERCYHFHGLFSGNIEMVRAISAKSGRKLVINHKQIYNCPAYKYGWFTASKIDNQQKCVYYLLKYMTKEKMDCVPHGKKHYWASRSLDSPDKETCYISHAEQTQLESEASYIAKYTDKFGNEYVVCDYWNKSEQN